MLGRTLGHYRLREQIGAGAMGVVYLAHDERLDRDVAVKVLPSTSQSEERRRRFRHEALALSRLNHPNIATIHDFETVEGLDLLVMEYIPGTSLDQTARGGPLPEADVLHLGVQLAEGLAAAHDHGVVHRDLKPANIRVTPDGRAKILDFGLARSLPAPDDQTRTATREHAFAGTLPYMAPELLTGSQPAVTSDVYALGAVLYELAAGHRPFVAQSDALLIDAILHQSPHPLVETRPGVSRDLDRVVMKALDRLPRRRYQSARELLVDLERIQQGAGAAATSVRPLLTRRGLIVGVAAATSVCLTGTVVWLSSWSAVPLRAFRPRDWVLIADFDNHTDDPHLDGTVRRALLIALQQSAYVNVLPDAQLLEALARMKRRDHPRLTDDVAAEICRRENLRLLIAGAVQQSGSAIQIAIRAVDPVDRSVLFAEKVDLQRRDVLFANVDDLARRVRQRLGESLAGIQSAAEPLARVTTSSLQALEQYSRAVEAMNRGSVEAAIALLEGALSVDPEFAMASSLIADAYLTLGNRQSQLRHLERAYAVRQDVTLRERYSIEAKYLGVHERYDEQADRLRALTSLYPDDAAARQQLAQALSNLMDLRGAIEQAREHIRLRGNAVDAYELLLLLLTSDGQNAEALRVFDSVDGILDPTPRLQWGVGMARFGLDQLDEARRVFGALAGTDGPYASIGRLYLARVDLYEGRFTSADAALSEDIGVDARQGYTAAEATRRYLRGRIRLAIGDSEGAARDAAAIAALPDAVLQAGDLLRAVILDARSGQRRKARATMARAEGFPRRAPSSFTRGIADCIAGEVALAEQDYAGAQQAFDRAFRQYPVHLAQQGLAEALAAQGLWGASAAAWERVLAARGDILRNGFAADWVAAHLGAAEAYQHARDLPRAQGHVEHAARIWRSADRRGPGARLQAAQQGVARAMRAAGSTGESLLPGGTK